MLTRHAAAFCAIACATSATAEAHAGDVDRLYDLLKLDEIVEIMNAEGVEYGVSVGEDLFPDRVDADWNGIVGEIYAVPRMADRVRSDLSELSADVDLAPIIDFFESDLGGEIAELEVSARRAMLDDDVEEAAKEAAALALMDETPRAGQIETFVEANALIEQNVVGALNSNYAFYMGLVDGGGFPQDLTEEQILTNVWSQEADIRANTNEWMYSFLMLAYTPLSDEDLDSYIAFSQTDAGQDLNQLLFGAFDPLFLDISRELGLASSRYMQGAEL